MNYKRIQQADSNRTSSENQQMTAGSSERINYSVYEREEQTAEFAYHVDYAKMDVDRGWDAEVSGGLKKFWIDEIRLLGNYAGYQTMDQILHFIQYKCWVSGCAAMYVRISEKNLFYQELYAQYGFYVIASEEKQILPGGTVYDSVMKYRLPDSKEEDFRIHMRRVSGDNSLY